MPLRRYPKNSPLYAGPPRAAARASSGDSGTSLGFIPADPSDPRLKVAGAVCGADGRVDIEAYEDIMQCWASEPPPEHHPDPMHPGVRTGEEIPQGLRMWDDVRAGGSAGGKTKAGAGWITVKLGPRGTRERRFNIRTCGSWRLAFLLARLQHSLWEIQDAPPRRVPVHLLSSPKKNSTPKRTLRRQASAEGSSGKRLRRQSSVEDSAEKVARPLKRQKSAEGAAPSVKAEKLWPGDAPKSKLNNVISRILARVSEDPATVSSSA